MAFMLNVVADFMGHRCALTGNNLDDLVKKSIRLNCPNKLLPLFKHHRQMLYYPDPKLIMEIINLHNENKDWVQMKEFYKTIGRK